MNTLERMATKIAKQQTDQSEKLVEEAKLLLAGDAQEERHVLHSIGLDANLSRIEQHNGDLIVRKGAGEFYGKKIIHLDELRTLCKDFRLIMRPARQYIGTVPPDLGAELKNFTKEKNIPLTGVTYSEFFIVAPPKMFSGYQTFSQIWDQENKIAVAARKERIRLKDEDPMLVYRLPSGHFAIIKSWGEDFTFMRRIYSFLVKKATTKWINFLTHVALLAAFFFIEFKFASFMFRLSGAEPVGSWGAFWLGAVAVITIVVTAVPAAIWLFDEDNQKMRGRILKAFYEKPWFMDNNRTYN